MTLPMSPHTVAEVRALAEKATPGPWYQPDGDNPELIFSGEPDQPAFLLAEAFREDSSGDAAYIAAANPSFMLSLLDALATAVAERDAMKGEWQPIETAPEGTDPLLLWRLGLSHAVIGRRNPDGYPGWQDMDCEGLIDPDYWRPIPARGRSCR